MNGEIFERADVLPQSYGVFNLIDSAGRNLFVGAAENIKVEARRMFAKNKLLDVETAKIETFEKPDEELIAFLAKIIRAKKPIYNFSLAAQKLYPHFKITNERFPRVLVTRRVEDDDAEYFGAFLPETGARFMLGFINRMFRPRGCSIPIDGSFDVPCPEFYRKRCLAPCVESLCDENKYLETINFARLFLQKNETELNRIVAQKIEAFAEDLNFERAAAWRDFGQTINNFWTDKERNYRLDDAKDTFEIKQTGAQTLVHLVTQRNRKNLGKRTFVFENKAGFAPADVLSQTLWQFYAVHAPKIIFVPVDFPQRKFLEKVLNERGAPQTVEIKVVKQSARKITVSRALKLTEFEFGQEALKPEKPLAEIQAEFQKIFALDDLPKRIEAFDVAHVSGTDFVGAKSVWTAGKFDAAEYEFWFSDGASELETLSMTLGKRFLEHEKTPDLILIDGGKAQLRAAEKSLVSREITIVSAVKPPQRHNEISHFLTNDGEKKIFDKNSDAMQILLKLRDEAHNLANYVHRTKRETAHFYEVARTLPGTSENERQVLLQHFGSLAQIKKATENEIAVLFNAEKAKVIYQQLRNIVAENFEPFIVPIRFDDPNGIAADLRPLDLPETIYRKLKKEGNGGGGRNRTDE